MTRYGWCTVGMRVEPTGQYMRCADVNKEIKRLKAILKEADDYLNTNSLTNIAHGSIMHQTFKDAIR